VEATTAGDKHEEAALDAGISLNTDHMKV